MYRCSFTREELEILLQTIKKRNKQIINALGESDNEELSEIYRYRLSLLTSAQNEIARTLKEAIIWEIKNQEVDDDDP